MQEHLTLHLGVVDIETGAFGSPSITVADFTFIIIVFTQPLRSGRIWHMVNFKRSLTGFNSEFSFS